MSSVKSDLQKKKAAEAAKRYRQRHPERSRASHKKWRDNNRDRWNESRRKWRIKDILRKIYTESKRGSKRRNIEFDLSFEDMPPIGTHCPILGHSFSAPEEGRTDFSPSLDRIDSSKGYVKGNVWIIGYRANRIKNDGTAEEHEKIAQAMRKALSM